MNPLNLAARAGRPSADMWKKAFCGCLLVAAPRPAIRTT
jgi:hypothetical protein